MATIKDVARHAGVSASTVSRALSGKIPVDEATRERVLRSVAELGYKPNLMARGLKEGRSRILALVLPDITNPFFPKLVQCVEERASERGYSLILCDCANNPEREALHIESLRNRYVDGVIYTGVTSDPRHIETLRRADVKVVVMNRDFDAGAPCVTNDNFAGGRAVIRHLAESGHRRIACLACRLDSQHCRQRLAGCVEAFREAGIGDYEQYLVRDAETIEDAHRHTLAFLSRRERPTAFFVFTDILAVGVYSATSDRGLRVPADVSVAGFDNIGLARHMIPPLTTYEHPVCRIAAAAVAILAAQIEEGGEAGYGTTVVAGGLIRRKSVAPQGVV